MMAVKLKAAGRTLAKNEFFSQGKGWLNGSSGDPDLSLYTKARSQYWALCFFAATTL